MASSTGRFQMYSFVPCLLRDSENEELALVVNNPRHWVLSGHAQSILDHWCNLNPVSEVCEAVLGSFFWNHNGLNKLPTRLADPIMASLRVNHSTCDELQSWYTAGSARTKDMQTDWTRDLVLFMTQASSALRQGVEGLRDGWHTDSVVKLK